MIFRKRACAEEVVESRWLFACLAGRQVACAEQRTAAGRKGQRRSETRRETVLGFHPPVPWGGGECSREGHPWGGYMLQRSDLASYRDHNPVVSTRYILRPQCASPPPHMAPLRASPLGGKVPVWPKRGVFAGYSCLLSIAVSCYTLSPWRTCWDRPLGPAGHGTRGSCAPVLGAIDRSEDMLGCFTQRVMM